MPSDYQGEETIRESADIPDRRLRCLLFWTVLSLFLSAVAASHALQWKCSYPLVSRDPATGRPVPEAIRHGSYGFYLGKLPARDPHIRTVMLFGNSVDQNYAIANRMQALADTNGQGIEFVNLGMTGSDRKSTRLK